MAEASDVIGSFGSPQDRREPRLNVKLGASQRRVNPLLLDVRCRRTSGGSRRGSSGDALQSRQLVLAG